ncbi:ABC transporter ATP-binding protein [Thermococcus thioreducens]|uniref:ABC-2 type transport system ATP-binding protein n=1 Tax=Thermococcus thioreducens TaxID=277988 RepID=A0A1I0MIH4_9EURY|nr:ABC transporter ATP-binding protein [Thermococcus thioreducens]SEV87868.1 ABC-2 type transport system ATP-binding protein [Thermococcus thioreducens]
MIVRAEKLTKRFGSVLALNSVEVEIPEGLTVIVGPNGGGKSTFLKIAAGAYRPTAGRVEVLGDDPWKNEQIKRRIGVSFDPPALPPLRTGLEWLEYISEARGGDGESVQKAAEMFEAREFIAKKIRDYSAGMRKRLSLAQAFVGDPEVVFLDEPLANLDLNGMRDVMEVIKEEHKNGLNLVVISHIWRPFMEIADYAVLIAAGKVQAAGSPEDVYPLLEKAFPL